MLKFNIKKFHIIEGVDLVLGASEKLKIKDYLQDLSKKDVGEVHFCHIEYVDLYFDSYYRGDKARAFLKDGCDYPCSYCTIILASGKYSYDSIQNVLKNAKEEIAKSGVKEIVKTGIMYEITKTYSIIIFTYGIVR